MGPAYGQAGFVAGQPVMPTGFLFEGVRWFESTNLPETSYNLVITDSDSAASAADFGTIVIFFGPQAVGVGTVAQRSDSVEQQRRLQPFYHHDLVLVRRF